MIEYQDDKKIVISGTTEVFSDQNNVISVDWEDLYNLIPREWDIYDNIYDFKVYGKLRITIERLKE